MRQGLSALFLLMILAACGSEAAKPSASYELGEIIYENHFDDPTTWESFAFVETQFGISGGTYNAISPGGGYVAVSNDHFHTNVVIETTTELISDDNDTGYGIECRAQTGRFNSVGYYFMLSGLGRYSIRLGDGSRVRVLVEWTEHPAVNRGRAINKIRAVCIDDYLALWVNDVFVAETRYDWLDSGNMGLAVTSAETKTIAVRYDDVTIWDAQLIEASSE